VAVWGSLPAMALMVLRHNEARQRPEHQHSCPSMCTTASSSLGAQRGNPEGLFSVNSWALWPEVNAAARL
jgi:hypothetical protein